MAACPLGPRSTDRLRTALSRRLDDLEYHRSIDVEARLAGALRVERVAFEAGLTDLQMRGRLVEADMRLRGGQATEAALLAKDTNDWALEHGPPALLARSHLVLSSIFESVGDSAAGLDHALRALEMLDDRTAPRTRGNFLFRLADALAVAESLEAARQRYSEAQAIFVSLGDCERQISVLNNLAFAEYEGGDAPRAWSAAQDMRRLSEAAGSTLPPPLLDTLARVSMALGEFGQAAAALESGLAGLDAQGDVEADTRAGLLLSLAEVRLGEGRPDAAQQSLDRCRAVCSERGLAGIEGEVLRVQAEIHAAAGRFEQAYASHRSFHAQFLRLTSARREANARTRQALFETAEARHDALRFQSQARTDALTGLPNRRFLDEDIPRLLLQVATGRPLVVAIVDADYFKRINDSLSHQVGDRAICELARVLEDAVRAHEGDAAGEGRTVARLGGEEFLIVLPGLGSAAGVRVLRDVCSRVAHHD